MKYTVFKGLSFLILLSLLSFDLSAVGLQEYLQNPDVEPITQTTPAATSAENIINTTSTTDSLFTQIIEMIVAGIVASALIISVLILFLGRWVGNKDKKVIKALRIDAEKEKDNITSAATTVREQEKETTQIVHSIQNQAAEFSSKKELIDKHSDDIQQSSELIKTQEQELTQVSENVSLRMNKIQSYWDTQLRDTVSTIQQVQSGLDKNLEKVDSDLDSMQRQKALSQELLQDFLDRHNEQSGVINKNSEMSEKVSQVLEETLAESNLLVQLLKKHQENAEKSLKQFTEELTVYEEQAYEQFDTSFQVADLARQELTANIDESRKHIETMRRHEEQSHNLNTQAQKNLEALDYSKIVKLSNTLDLTQDMFTDIRSKVDDAKNMLDELKDIETDVRETANNVENVINKKSEEISKENNAENEADESKETVSFGENVYKIASGDNTPLSFFTNIKKKD